MKKLSLITALLMTPMLISGCTAILWANEDKGFLATGKVITDKDPEYKVVAEDQILGFAQVRTPDTDQVQLMVVGKQYAYQIQQGQGQAFNIINSGLNVSALRLIRPNDPNFSLNFYLDEDNKARLGQGVFETTIYMTYDQAVISTADKALLDKLGFELYEYQDKDQKKTQRYVKKMVMHGKMVGLNAQLKALKFQSFSKAYPIHIHSIQTGHGVDFKVLFRKIALTPVTLVGDALIIPIGLVGTAAMAVGHVIGVVD